MSSAKKSSRSRLKFRPPKVLIYSLLCLLALSMILLIAQLRAIELTPKHIIEDLQQRINDSKIIQRPTTTVIDQIPNNGPQNNHSAAHQDATQTEAPSTPRLDSIDRDDRAPEGNNDSNLFATRSQNEQSQSSKRLDMGAAIEPAATVSSPVLVAATGQQPELPPEPPSEVPTTGGMVSTVPEIATNNELIMQQAAAQLMASVNQQPGLQTTPPAGMNLIGLPKNGPTLAELTAAGTAAGLLMHDLVAQANMVEQLPMNQPGVWAGDNSDEGGEITPSSANANNDQEAARGEPPVGSLEEQMQAQQARERQQEVDEDDEADPEVPLARRLQMKRAEGAEEERPQGRLQTAANHQAAPAAETEGGAPVPTDENQTPDSIESLMGDDLAAAMADSQDGSAGGDPSGGEQAASSPDEGDNEQHLAGTNLHAQNNNEPTGLSREQVRAHNQKLMAVRSNAHNEADDPTVNSDEDSDADERQSPQLPEQGAATLSPLHSAMLQRRADEVPLQALGAHTSRGQPILVARNGLVSGGRERELDHNIVAPMRDSIVDLNAAAGHYYGKKKKKVKKVKKVKKKIIIKKKKKKKIKYKKYKVVKIKKKKKKKKKVKKHHHHHKKGHHDHGKYYMYAKVPKKKAWEFGFKKGNKKHWISRHEKGYKNKFKTKVKWYDKKSKGKGFHVWDYNHHDKKKKKHHH